MKVIPNLTFVVEVFPSNGIYIVRGANGLPLTVLDSSAAVADWIDERAVEQRVKLEQIEKDNVVVDNF